jgi:HlyD family secretion protein
MKSANALLICVVLAGCSAAEPPLQGYVEGEYVRVAAPIAGTLVKLEVQRGALVESGTPLFTLEAENEAAGRREAENRVRTAEAQLANLQKGRRPPEVDTARAQLAQAQAALKMSGADYERTVDLVKKNFLSQQKLDEARAALDRDRARVAELSSQLTVVQMPARSDEIRAAESEVGAARQSLAQADWRLKQKQAASSVSGTVTDTLFVQGEWVGAGAPVVAILPPGNIKARFFVSETKLGAVKVGQGVELRCDGCAAAIPARITFIAPQAEFTPPVIYSKDSRAKLVFLVEARPDAADATKLHPGQPLDVVLK